MTEVEKAAQAWLVANDWDYKKYGDRRPDRSAYDGLMNYEISGELEMAFEAGAQWGIERAAKAVEDYSDYGLASDRAICELRHKLGCKCTPTKEECLIDAIKKCTAQGTQDE